ALRICVRELLLCLPMLYHTRVPANPDQRYTRRNLYMRRIAFALALVMLATVYALLNVQAENWPQWRGPMLNGISNEKNLPVKWTTEENITWKLAMPDK